MAFVILMLKLTEQQRDDALKKLRRGWSYERTCAWLERTHGVAISKQALHGLAQRHPHKDPPSPKAAGREGAASPTAEAFRRGLHHRHARSLRILRAIEGLALDDPDAYVALYVKAAGAYAKICELVQRAVDAEAPDEPGLEGLYDLLGLAKAEREAETELLVHAAWSQKTKPVPPSP